MSGYRLIRRATAGDAFPQPQSLTAHSFGLPFAATGEHYYGSFLPDTYRDTSFAFADDAGCIAIIACDTMAAERIGRFGVAIEIGWRDGVDPGTRARIVRDSIAELQRIAGETGRGAIDIRTSTALDPDGILAARLNDIGAEPAVALRCTLDLARNDSELLNDMRKGHRQQVRWGQQSLRLESVGADEPDRARFALYQQLHAQVSGRVTRPQSSWDAMFDLVARGDGDLILGWLGEELVSGTLILDAGDTAYYGSGANRRDHFDKPISHWPIFAAAGRARARGRTRFDVGETRCGTIDMTNPKEVSIGRFKSGFSGTCDTSLIWTIPAKQG